MWFIFLLLCIFGNSAELGVEIEPWWNDIFGDGLFRESVDNDVSIQNQNWSSISCLLTYKYINKYVKYSEKCQK